MFVLKYIVYIFIGVLAWWVQSPHHFTPKAVGETYHHYVNKGQLPTPGVYRTNGPWPYAYRWDPSNEKVVPSILHVMDYLKSHSSGFDIVCAPLFGVPLQACFFPSLDVYMLNMDVVSMSEKTQMCSDSLGTKEVVKHEAPDRMTLSYVDIFDRKTKEVTLSSKLTCLTSLFLSEF
jgi:hypothetical protein